MPFSIDFSRSLVVAPVCTQSDLDFVAAVKISDFCDVIELRLDSLRDEQEQIDSLLADNRPNLPILATARHPAEGGAHSLDVSARQQLFLHFLPQVDAVDIELRSIDDMKEVIDAVQSAGKPIILSYHDFESTPTTAEIRSIIDQAVAAGADVCKIALHLDSEEVLADLIQICEAESRIKLSLMGMGPLGKPSRLELAKAGSVLNYGYLKEANAPGQWPAKELKQQISEM